MAKDKPLKPGDTVYHRSAEEKIAGTVVSVELVEVDWGPEHCSSVHHEHTLTTKYTPKFGDA